MKEFDLLSFINRALYLDDANPKSRPMKTIIHLYKSNPILAMIVNCLGFFVYATTLIMIVVILSVALSN